MANNKHIFVTPSMLAQTTLTQRLFKKLSAFPAFSFPVGSGKVRGPTSYTTTQKGERAKGEEGME
jgi:hypothetical protein